MEYKGLLDRSFGNYSAFLKRVENGERGMPFAASLMPIMSHPRIEGISPRMRYELAGKKLHHYHRFTSQLENKAIVPACTILGLHEGPFELSDVMAFEAMIIAAEETSHAVMSEHMRYQIAMMTGVTPSCDGEPRFLKILRATLEGLDEHEKALAIIVFACVSETLITSTLTKVPQDPTVMRPVADMIMHHARDEAKHNKYFTVVIKLLRERLTDTDLAKAAPRFAEYIAAFVEPDCDPERVWLEGIGFGETEAARIVAESYEAIDLKTSLREAAMPTITIMKRFGLLEVQSAADALMRRELI
jgi:hypothetical protein